MGDSNSPPGSDGALRQADIATALNASPTVIQNAGTQPAEVAVPVSNVPGLPRELSAHSRYRVIRVLGEGGMGAVFLAEHIKMERQVALKVIHGSLLNNELAIQRFHQEVKAASRLVHPNIVTAYDADEAGTGPRTSHFLVMEFVDGKTLNDYLYDRGPLPSDEACAYVRQAALGLQHAFEKGMVHRDIKPHNLMRSNSGEIKILDFGLARLVRQNDGDGGVPLTAEGIMMGTVDYMAPEQAGDSRGVDIRADIYSLGCTLYQLLTGSVPFPEGGLANRLLKHKTQEPKPIRELRPEIPPGVAAVVAKMMAKNPNDRYATPAEIAAALEPFVDSARRDTSVESAPTMIAGAGAIAPVARTVANPKAAVAPQSAAAKNPSARKGGNLVLLIAAGFAFLAAATAIALGAFIAFGGGRKPTLLGSNPSGTAAAMTTSTTSSTTTPANAIATVPATTDQTAGVKDDAEVPAAAAASASDFLEIHGADQDTFQKWMDTLGEKEMRPLYLCAQAGLETTPRFNGIAVRTSGHMKRKFVMDYTLGTQHISKESPVRVAETCLYLKNQQFLIAETQLEGRLAISHGLFPFEAGIEKLRERQKTGLTCPRGLSITIRPSGVPWISIYSTPKEDAKWDFQFDLSLAKLRELETDLRKENRMPRLLYAYGNAEPFKFIVVYVENPKKEEWSTHVGMTAQDYEKYLAENTKKGLRPIAVTSYGTDAPHYAAIWERFKTADK